MVTKIEKFEYLDMDEAGNFFDLSGKPVNVKKYLLYSGKPNFNVIGKLKFIFS